MIALVVLIVLFAAEIAGYIFELHKHTLASQALMVCLASKTVMSLLTTSGFTTQMTHLGKIFQKILVQ